MAARLFLGIDGGGSKSRARVCDDGGAVLGEATAGPGNARLGDLAYTEIMKASRGALAAAGLKEADFARIHAGFGLAGVQQDEDRDQIRNRPYPFASLIIDTDAYTAYMGAYDGADGAILILGTGSGGLAVVNGKRLNVGGWGNDIADEGSGMLLGRQAIRKSLWALEGMAPLTPLADSILNEFDRNPPKAVMWAGRAIPGDYARFAPRVFEFAKKGDELAVGLVEEGAAGATMLIRRLLELGAPTVAMIGGLFPALYPWLAPEIQAKLVKPAGDPITGAIRMAERSLRGIGTGRPPPQP
ncbi:MAG TPA: BadF/BadG/BcrA/BcrD ATPase family protein [Bauldia sp.]|nr:BadF/BadG/BcrA/BcrD ATPase family protein [Bauldia sp.]